MDDAYVVGDLRVVPLVDAAGTFPQPTRETFHGATEGEWARVASHDPEAAGPRWHLPFRCFAVLRPDATIVLVDTGVGPGVDGWPTWTPTPGRLPQTMAEQGLNPADVEVVVLTHLHEDHVGWAAVDGRAVFDATYVVGAAELEAMPAGTWLADDVVAPLERSGQLERVSGSHVLTSGVTLVPTPGHSVGHQSVLLEGGGDRLWLTGDVIVHPVQLVSAQVRYAFDADPVAAHDSRELVLGDARRHDSLLGTSHLSAPFVAPVLTDDG